MPKRTDSEQQQCIHKGELQSPSVRANVARLQPADRTQAHQEQTYAEAVFKALPDPIVVMDLEGRIRHANRRFLRAVGQTQEQVVGRTPSDLGFLSTEQLLRLRNEVFPKLARKGPLINIRTVVQRPDGRSFPALLSFGLLRSATGEPEAIVGTSRDISPLEQVHKAMTEKQKTLEAILHAIPESLFLLDSQGHVLVCNETAATRAGRSVDELVGGVLVEDPAGIAPSDPSGPRMGKVAEVLRSGEAAHFTKEHDGLVFEHTLYPVPNDDGQAARSVVVFARDITKRAQTEKELHEYRERLQTAEQLASLGMLSATLVHELTQPLSVIRLANQTALARLRKLHCPNAIRQDLEASLAASATIAGVIGRFRDYTRQSATARKTEVHVSRVAKWTIRLLEHSAQQARVTVRTANLETLPAIRMRENELEQLVFALVQNAIQAANADKDRCLLISGLLHGDTIELRFQDDCGGIDPALLPRLFKPFFTTKPAGKGTGLGLCIVRRIVQQTGGQISVQNRHGEGVTFTVTLPRK